MKREPTELTDIIAGKIQMQRTHNPQMGGPNHMDKRNADDIVNQLVFWLDQVGPITVNGKELTLA